MNPILLLADRSWRVLPHLLDDDRPWWRRLVAPPERPTQVGAGALARAIAAVAHELGGPSSLHAGRDVVQVVLPLADQRRLRADRRAVQALVAEALGVGVGPRVELVPDHRGALRPGEIVVRVLRGPDPTAHDPAATVLAGSGGAAPAVVSERTPPVRPAAASADGTLPVLDPWDVPEPKAVRRPRLRVRVDGRVVAEVEAGRDVVVGRGGATGPGRIVLPTADARISREHVVLRLDGERVTVRRPPTANPVSMGREALQRDAARTALLPAAVELSLGTLVLGLERAEV